jgi:hypothetical protein
MQVSLRDNSIQNEVEQVHNQMQTTQKQFNEVAIETEELEEEELNMESDQGTQTD